MVLNRKRVAAAMAQAADPPPQHVHVAKALFSRKLPARWMDILAIDKDDNLVMVRVADPRRTTCGHDAVIATYSLLEERPAWWQAIGLMSSLW